MVNLAVLILDQFLSENCEKEGGVGVGPATWPV